MKEQTPTLQQPNIGFIFSILFVGFALLLRSTMRLVEISDAARYISDDYKGRLELALKLREEAVNVVAQAKLVRTTQYYTRIKILPFNSDLGEARLSFQQVLKQARTLWGERLQQQDLQKNGLGDWRALSQRELDAWRRFETKAEHFQRQIDEAVYNKPVVAPTPSSVPTSGAAKVPAPLADPPPTSAQSLPTIDPTAEERARFNRLRTELPEAARELTSAIVAAQDQSILEVADQQQRSAQEIQLRTWGAMAVGIIIGILVFIFIHRRVVSLRRALRDIREASDFAQSVFDSQPNDILVFNERGEQLAFNQAFLNDFHLTRSEVTLQDYRGTLAHLPEVASIVGESLQQRDDNTVRHEQKLVVPRNGAQPDGVARLFDIKVSPLTISQQTRGRVVVLEDITASVAMREEVERSRTLSTVGQITAQVAHELYNPIGAIKLNIELLEMQSGDDNDIKHTVARLKRGVAHLNDIVLDLRYLTRPREPERQPTDVNKLLDEVVELASDRLERSRIIIERDFAPAPPPGDFDPQQLRKVFLNLLINAVEASPPNSSIELHTRFIPSAELPNLNGFAATRGALRVSVVDHGAGMSEETKRRVFEAFYTTKRNGTGLGMMITQQIIKKHQGQIEIESAEEQGTTVSVYLPV
jgi:signal transduction histidine kinase